MSDSFYLNDTNYRQKPGRGLDWTYSAVDNSWTTVSTDNDASLHMVTSSKYLPKGSNKLDQSIRFTVGDILGVNKYVGFESFDNRYISPYHPQAGGFVLINTTVGCYFGNANLVNFGAGALPGANTLAAGDELRVQILKTGGNYALLFKWRRASYLSGAEQLLYTAATTSATLVALLANNDLFTKINYAGGVANGKIKDVLFEVTDSGSGFFVDPVPGAIMPSVGYAPQGGAFVTPANYAGIDKQIVVPNPTVGQLWPLGDGRDFIE